jgi:thiamine-monophosphate kinase
VSTSRGRDRPAQRLCDLGEFGLIARIARAARRSSPRAGVVLGIGDDAALLRLRAGEDVAMSADTFVENVHFRWRDEAPRNVGRRALVANLSDLAAMGARPLGFTLALAVPGNLLVRDVDAVIAGLLHEARAHACPLVGGNVTRARDTHLAISVLGAVARGRALLRQRARPGDRVLVTGVLGAAALERARVQRRGGRIRHVARPRLRAGQRLARIPQVSACIDVSDGFEADLRHLLGPDLRLRAFEGPLPRPPGFDTRCRRLRIDPESLLRTGGEDYELLFTLHPSGPSAVALGRRLAVPISEIGRVERGRPQGGEAGGWRHF